MSLLKDVIGYGTHADRPAAGSEGRLYYETDTDTLFRDGGTTWNALTLGGGGGGLYSAYLCYQDQKTATTTGGTFTSGAWQTRTLNTEVADTGGHGSLASNQITLDAGTYRVLASAPGYACGVHKARLYDITNSAVLLYGTSEYAFAGDDTASRAFVIGRISLAGTTVIELQHRCSVTSATWGLGIADGWDTEVYATIELFKE